MNPRAGFPTYALSRGSKTAHKPSKHHKKIESGGYMVATDECLFDRSNAQNSTGMMLLSLGLDPSSLGFFALSESIEIARKYPIKRTAVFKEIYPEVAKKLEIQSIKTVDTLVRRQLLKISEHSPEFIQQELFCPVEKFSPAKAIAAFAVYLDPAE